MSQDFTPRYFEIESSLRELISRSEPGDLLPSESELCEQFGVSRMTARHAMQRLVQQGLVYRVSGKGSFVANAAAHRKATKLMSFSAEMRQRGHVPSSRVLTLEERVPSDLERGTLQLTGPGNVVEIHRVRLADDLPVAHERAVLVHRKCPGILDADVATESLHTLLRRLGCRPTRGTATLAAEPATDEDVELLRVASGASILVERRLIMDQRDEPLEYTTSRYAGDRYMLDVDFDVETPVGG